MLTKLVFLDFNISNIKKTILKKIVEMLKSRKNALKLAHNEQSQFKTTINILWGCPAPNQKLGVYPSFPLLKNKKKTSSKGSSTTTKTSIPNTTNARGIGGSLQ